MIVIARASEPGGSLACFGVVQNEALVESDRGHKFRIAADRHFDNSVLALGTERWHSKFIRFPTDQAMVVATGKQCRTVWREPG